MDHGEEIFRDLCENAHDLIQSVAPDGRFLYVNRAWLEILGYRRDEVEDLRVFDIIHPDSRAHCEQVMAKLLTGEPAVRISADFVAKDGRRVAVEGSAGCRFEEGKPVFTRGIFRDVTERKKTEEELDRFFQLSLDLLCVAGTDGYFKQISPAFERVLGYEREELLSRSFLDFVHPDDRESTVREVENLAEGRLVVDFENRYRAKDGTYRWLAWRSAPLASQGLIYAVARDITEAKHSKELLARQAQELARSNEDLEQFAYVASHDLRAPLRAIGHLAEWLDQDLSKGDRAKAGERLAEMRTRARRMEGLIDDLLQYSRAGREADDVGRVDTGALVRGVIDLLAIPDGFVVALEGRMPVLESAKTPLEQVFRNLIGNAVKHHDGADGRVTVSARDVGDSFEFAVADDGPGIAPRHRDRVFQMFQKLRAAREAEGTGLGLALVKRIVETHGGQVWLEAEEGRGATFRFTWPKRIGQAPSGDGAPQG